MGRRLIAALVIVTGMIAAHAAQRQNPAKIPPPKKPGPPADAAVRLADALTSSTELATDLRYLCDHIGGRLTGSDACRLAVTWTKSRFEDAGLKVGLESFSMPRAWLPGTISATVTTSPGWDLTAATVPFSPDAEVTAPLYDAGGGSPIDIERAGFAATGAIGLVRTAEMKTLGDLFAEYMRDREMLEAAKHAGSAGLLLMSTRPKKLLYRHPIRIDGTLAPVPVALIAREDAQRLGRLLDANQKVEVQLSLKDTQGGPIESNNVIADIPGREHPEEIVLFGAHLDSWDLGTGAEDNGVNCASVIAVARALKSLGFAPRRTIRFALFTGEEQGLWGSRGYVERHAAEMDDHVAVVIMDIGSGRVTGYFLNGREDLRKPVERALSAISGFGSFEHPIEALDGTDNFDFLLSGVPNLVANHDTTHYLPDYHAASDVFETVNLEQASKNAAITAALLWHLAESAERPAPRQTRREVEDLIRRTGLEPQMRAFGQWEEWNTGRRGAR